jgi:hypothetical protein
MGLLRLMGNKADVVKGLAKRCNENWKVAPTGDIVRPTCLFFFLCLFLVSLTPSKGIVSLGHSRPSDHDDTKLESLREDTLAHALELPRADQHRDDRREQPNQRGPIETHCTGYDSHPDEPHYRYRVSSLVRKRKVFDCTNVEKVFGA